MHEISPESVADALSNYRLTTGPLDNRSHHRPTDPAIDMPSYGTRGHMSS